MIALQIADIRSFMKKLLLGEAFDRFLLLEGSITTFSTFHVDGQLQKSYYTSEEQDAIGDRTLAFWGEVRPFCFELIKGKRTPLSFRFTFQLAPANVEKLLRQTGIRIPPGQVRGLLMNLRYDGHSLQCVTGTSLSVFTLDRDLDHAWDDMVQKYFRQQEIPFELL
ncbi:MAG: DUF5721 family protein [Eubacteriales bacterium]|nr:DUF5721 family protein [Eubacteriales bacterium]